MIIWTVRSRLDPLRQIFVFFILGLVCILVVDFQPKIPKVISRSYFSIFLSVFWSMRQLHIFQKFRNFLLKDCSPKMYW